MSSSPNEAPSEGLSLRDELYYEIEGVLQDTKDGAPMDKVCRETLLRVQSRLDSALSATPASDALRLLSEDVMRCIDASWKPGYARDYGNLGPILAEYIDDLRRQALPAAFNAPDGWHPDEPNAPLPATQRSILDPSVYDEMDQHRAPAKQRSKPDLWWNGFRRYDERSGTYPSVAEHEDTNHDIPLYSGVNPCNAPLSETPAGGTAKVQEWKEISADMLLGWEEAECEKQELKAVIKSAYLDLAALCPNPSDDDPDFETCLGRRNSADEKCLVRAYLALRAMLAAAPSPDGNDQGTGGAR
jgi:hypothetical protein